MITKNNVEEIKKRESTVFNRVLAVTVGLLMAGWLGVEGQAFAIDVDTGDWGTAPAGTDVGLLYVQHASRSTFYSNGNRVLDNAQLNSSVGIARYVHWASVGGYTVAPQVLLPFGRLEAEANLSSLGSASGTGDIIFALPIWLIDNKVDREAITISPYIFLPTGSYEKNRPLNLGENRRKYNLQAGYTHGIGSALNVELTGDVMFFEDNSDTSLSQKSLTQVQAYLSYQWSPGTRLALGLSQAFGGETSIAGVAQNDRTKTTKAILTASTFIDNKNQLMFSYGKDLNVENGLKEDFRANLRVLHVF